MAKEEITSEQVSEAIEIIERCRQIHIDWAEWQEVTPEWKDHTEPDSPGGPEHHREWVQKYDTVLEVLTKLE